MSTPDVFTLYNRLEFVLCSGTFNPCVKPDGSLNKNFQHDSTSWKNDRQRKCHEGRNGYALLTGAKA